MSANVGLALQCVAILLVALLSLSVCGSIRSPSLKYWATAWVSLSLALMSLFTGFHVAVDKKVFFSIYFLGEYLFGLMFIAGCRLHATRARWKALRYFLVPAAIFAVLLPRASLDFNDLFIVQATIMAVLFASAFLALRPALRKQSTPGVRVMAAALVLLTIDFLQYVPVFGARKGLWGLTVPAGYLQYTSIFDLILEILLGFGTMMVLVEGMRGEVEAANRKLTSAHDKLQLLARMDPLTEALNRHAFHSLLSSEGDTARTDVEGCVAVIDIDNLKPINDTFGHSVGDKTIRAVARAVRSLIRADDMLFRWGGDEFLVLMLRLRESEATRRMQTLNEILAQNCEQWTQAPVKITVSTGVKGFTSMNELAHAIEEADKAMYRGRHERRAKTIAGTQDAEATFLN
jgi:diguanylate cyclase (GGDEF)-like protein